MRRREIAAVAVAVARIATRQAFLVDRGVLDVRRNDDRRIVVNRDRECAVDAVGVGILGGKSEIEGDVVFDVGKRMIEVLQQGKIIRAAGAGIVERDGEHLVGDDARIGPGVADQGATGREMIMHGGAMRHDRRAVAVEHGRTFGDAAERERTVRRAGIAVVGAPGDAHRAARRRVEARKITRAIGRRRAGVAAGKPLLVNRAVVHIGGVESRHVIDHVDRERPGLRRGVAV